MSGDRGKGQSTHCCFRCERKHRRTHPKAIAVRTRAQASPSRPIAQIRSGIVRGSLRLPTQIVEEPGAGVSWLVTPRLHAKVGVGLAQAALLFTPASESQATPPAPTIKEGRAARTGSIALLATSVLQTAVVALLGRLDTGSYVVPLSLSSRDVHLAAITDFPGLRGLRGKGPADPGVVDRHAGGAARRWASGRA